MKSRVIDITIKQLNQIDLNPNFIWTILIRIKYNYRKLFLDLYFKNYYSLYD